MVDFLSLVKKTGAYKTLHNDVELSRLSHAYLILCTDKACSQDYVKWLVKTIICKDEDAPCGKCRNCNLVENKIHPDVLFFPKDENKGVRVEDIVSLIEESYIKPIENDKKIFVIQKAETMNLQSQNKILKILEEPPKNVHIILSATSEFALLPTVLSRVKKLTVPSFDEETLLNCLTNDFPDTEKLKLAIACSDGSVGDVISLYGDEKLLKIEDFVVDMILNMQSSKDILLFEQKIADLGEDIEKIVSILEITFRDMLVNECGGKVINRKVFDRVKDKHNYTEGALIYALDKLIEFKKRKQANTNGTMTMDYILFQILEGKYKWQK